MYFYQPKQISQGFRGNFCRNRPKTRFHKKRGGGFGPLLFLINME